MGVLQFLGADITQHDAQGEEAEKAEDHEDIEGCQLAVLVAREPAGWPRRVAALLNCPLPQLGQHRCHGCGVGQDHPESQGFTPGG